MAETALKHLSKRAVTLRKAKTNPAAVVYLASLAPLMAPHDGRAADFGGSSHRERPGSGDWSTLRFEHVTALRARL